MLPRAYTVFGLLVLGALAWAHYTGWAPGRVDEVKNVPQPVRENPGSYRSAYRTYWGGGRGFGGGK